MTDFSRRLASLTSEPSRDDAGNPDRLARVERTRSEMMLQGSAIAATLQAQGTALADIAAVVAPRGLRRIVVTGCGDSWFAAMGVRHAFESLTGLPFEAAQALDFAAYGAQSCDDKTLVIGISSGGNTPAVMAALVAAQARGAFALGVSNTPGSAILGQFDGGLQVHALRKGWPTQSTNATMALLITLAQQLAPGALADESARQMAALVPMLDALASQLDATMEQIAREICAAPLVLFAGLGPNLAAAQMGAAKVKELSPIHALALPLEEYHHYRTQKSGDPLFLVATDAASAERALDTALVSQSRGGYTVALLSTPSPEIAQRVQHVVMLPPVAATLCALVASVPLHLLAYHFAKARDALGLGYASTPATPSLG
ncbi:MAG: SIS domain-containing protein [Rhodoferax sp.]|nr:SIS domain-containing protein [Rhodoferax sp.]